MRFFSFPHINYAILILIKSLNVFSNHATFSSIASNFYYYTYKKGSGDQNIVLMCFSIRQLPETVNIFCTWRFFKWKLSISSFYTNICTNKLEKCEDRHYRIFKYVKLLEMGILIDLLIRKCWANSVRGWHLAWKLCSLLSIPDFISNGDIFRIYSEIFLLVAVSGTQQERSDTITWFKKIIHGLY